MERFCLRQSLGPACLIQASAGTKGSGRTCHGVPTDDDVAGSADRQPPERSGVENRPSRHEPAIKAEHRPRCRASSIPPDISGTSVQTGEAAQRERRCRKELRGSISPSKPFRRVSRSICVDPSDGANVERASSASNVTSKFHLLPLSEPYTSGRIKNIRKKGQRLKSDRVSFYRRP